MKTDELTAVGAIYALIITIALYFTNIYNHNKQFQKLAKITLETQRITLETQRIAMEAKAEQKRAYQAVDKVYMLLEEAYSDIDYYQKLVGIKEELKDYSTEEIAMGLALAWTESSWNYEANHNSSAKGICGVVPKLWEDYLIERYVELNSVAACIEIFKYYREDNTRKQAIKEYKGIESKKREYLIPYTIKIRNLILKRLQQ